MNKHVYVKVFVEVVGNPYDDNQHTLVSVWGLVARLPDDAKQVEAHRWTAVEGAHVFDYHGPVAVPE